MLTSIVQVCEKKIQFHYKIAVNDQNCVPKCKVFPALFTSLVPKASIVLF